MGYDCSEEANTIGEHYRMEMKLDGGKSITYASLLFLEDGDGTAPEFPCILDDTYVLNVGALMNQDYFIGDPLMLIDLTGYITAEPDE